MLVVNYRLVLIRDGELTTISIKHKDRASASQVAKVMAAQYPYHKAVFKDTNGGVIFEREPTESDTVGLTSKYPTLF